MGASVLYNQRAGFAYNAFNQKNTIVCIGDSVAEHDKPNGGDPNAQTDRGIFTWTNYLLGQRLRVINHPSTDGSGQTTAQILSRLSSEALAYNPGYVWFEGGINDIGNDVSADTIVSNWESVISQCRAAGAIPIICTIMPNANITSAARATTWHEANSRLRQIGYLNPDVIVVNLDWPYVDDTSATYPTADTALNYTVDGTHQSNLGAYTLALQAYADLVDRIPAVEPPFIYHQSGSGDSSIWPNPLNETFVAVDGNDTGTTGTKPTGIRVKNFSSSTANTATATSSARADNKPGSWLEVAFTGAATYTFPSDYVKISTTSATGLGGLTAGTDKVVFLMEYEMDASPTNFLGMKLSLDWNGAGSANPEVLNVNASSEELPDGVQSGIIMTNPTVIPSAATGFWADLEVYPSAANASFTFRVGRCAIRKWYE